MLPLVIFDLDGVLINTVPLHYESWKTLFQERGVEYDEDDYVRCNDGVKRDEGIRNVLGPVSKEELARLAQRKQEIFTQCLQRKPPQLMPGAHTLLSLLESMGWQKAVASSSKNAIMNLERFTLLSRFATVVSGYDFIHSKPDPEVFLITAERLSVDPKDCIVIEDSPSGIAAAARAGMKSIGLEYFHRRLLPATVRVKSLEEVTRTLLEQTMEKK